MCYVNHRHISICNGHKLFQGIQSQNPPPKPNCGRGLFQDNPTPMQRALELTEWFDENENYVNHVLWPSQLPDFNAIKDLREILDLCVL